MPVRAVYLLSQQLKPWGTYQPGMDSRAEAGEVKQYIKEVLRKVRKDGMKIKKATLTLALALAVVVGMVVGANAADTLKTITASLNYGITIKYNGEVQEMKDANSNRVYPISYEGTTYLPVRAVANLLGIEVNWDGPTQTVWLGEGFVPTPTPQASDTSSNTASANPYTIPAGTVVTIDGKEYTSTGEPIFEGKTLGGKGFTIGYNSSGQKFAIANNLYCATLLIDSDVDLGDGGQSLAEAGMITHTEEGSGGFYG